MSVISDTETKIASLHEWYCSRTGLQMRLIFSRQLWFDRLRDYEYDAEKLRVDCDLIVRYLKREIARDKRFVGALKLSNFLQPDNFDADLAIARLEAKQTSTTKSTKKHEAAIESPADRDAIARGLRKFRERLAGGSTQ